MKIKNFPFKIDIFHSKTDIKFDSICRSAHSAGPGEWKRIKGKEVKGRGKKEYGGGETDKARRMREPT